MFMKNPSVLFVALFIDFDVYFSITTGLFQIELNFFEFTHAENKCF